jgi:hypothetical protein
MVTRSAPRAQSLLPEFGHRTYGFGGIFNLHALFETDILVGLVAMPAPSSANNPFLPPTIIFIIDQNDSLSLFAWHMHTTRIGCIKTFQLWTGLR